MDHFAPRRHRMALCLAMTLGLAMWPVADGRAVLPHLSNEPAGDPGDGVLRPADHDATSQTPAAQSVTATTTGTATPTDPRATFLLVPVVAPSGQPWSLTFRLVRVDRDIAASWWQTTFGGRWHRAP